MGVGRPAGGLIELGEGKGRQQFVAPSTLRLRHSYGGLEGFFGRRRVKVVALEEKIAAEAMKIRAREMLAADDDTRAATRWAGARRDVIRSVAILSGNRRRHPTKCQQKQERDPDTLRDNPHPPHLSIQPCHLLVLRCRCVRSPLRETFTLVHSILRRAAEKFKLSGTYSLILATYHGISSIWR